MRLLNSKSILNCSTKQDKEAHISEIDGISENIFSIPNYKTILRYRFMDEAHQRIIEMFEHCNLHEFLESIERIECEKRYDFAVQEDEYLTVVIYGHFHLLNNAFNIIETQIDVLTFDRQNKFINILPYVELNSMNEI